MAKDVKLAVNAAKAENLELPMLAESDKMYSLLKDNADYATLDFSAVFRYLDPKKSTE